MIEKVTPYKDITWYVKWTATVLLMLGVSCRAAGLSPVFDYTLVLLGEIGWLYVAYRWHDRALIVVTATTMIILLTGALRLIGNYMEIV